jgi:hypothetical protein
LSPCSSRHLLLVNSGSVRGAALLAQKNYYF